MKRILNIVTLLLIAFLILSYINKLDDEYVMQRLLINGKGNYGSGSCLATYRKINYIILDIWKNDCGESYFSFWGHLYQGSMKTTDYPKQIGT